MGKKNPAGPKHGLLVHVLLDKSGSMRNYADETIKAFNEFINQLKAAITPATITLSTFNANLYPVLEEVPIYEMTLLTHDNYSCTGGTVISLNVIEVLKAMAQVDAVQRVLIIQTDGSEGSREHTDAAKQAISEAYKTGWLVLFLGAGAKAAQQSKLLGIPKEFSLNYDMKNIIPVMTAAALATLRYSGTGDTKAGAFTEADKLIG